MKKLINLTAFSILSAFILFCSGTESKTKNLQTGQSEKSGKIFYSDANNPHAKMQFPMLIEWSYDSKIVPGSSVSVDLTATALQNMTNATLVAELKQPLILKNGNLNTGSSTLNSGEKMQISAVVEAPETGSFEIDVHVSGFIAGNKMGSSRAIVFESFDYSGSSKEKSAKPKTEIIGGQEYSVLPGKTDNEKK